jgi:hypothetical protein
MRQNMLVILLVAGVGAFTTGCAKPPQADIDAAQAAIQKASNDGAADYAADSLKSAQDAESALEAELKVQADKFSLSRSYSKAGELAVAAKTAGEKAEQDAIAGKEQAKNDASAVIEEAKAALTQAQDKLSNAPRGKGTQADLGALEADLTGAESSIADAENAFAAERYLDARAKAEAAKTASDNVTAAVDAATAARRGRR